MKVGGQAVIEGVMMRYKEKVSTAVRKKGKIIFHNQKVSSVTKKHPVLKIPLVRGFVFLIEMIVVGMKSLIWSAGQQDDEGEISNTEASITVMVSLLLGLGLFILLPYWLATFIAPAKTVAFNIWDGVFRLVIFVAYLLGIGLWADIKTVFQYHGAEHKAVNCYESKKKLTVENCKKSNIFHPRCGTSLLLFVVLISIFVFAVVRTPHWYYNILARIVLVPVIVGISYEILMFTANHYDNKFVRWLSTPGQWTQSLTTREPTGKQIEVAIAAIKKVT